MKILKFGGSSVGSAENIGKVIEIVKNASRADSCAVVLSAMSGATDALINIAKAAESGDENFRVKIKELETKHTETAHALLGENSQDGGIFDFIENRFNELKNICEGVFLLRELSARTLDRIVSFGEMLSTKIVAAKFNSLGVENVWKDSRQLIKTDSNFGNAAVEFEKTNQLIKEFFGQTLATRNSQLATVFILQGFIASDSENVTTTLGRGGSDYTARDFGGGFGRGSFGNLDGCERDDDRRPAHRARVSANPAHYLPRGDGAFTLRREGNLSADDSAGFAEKYSDFY